MDASRIYRLLGEAIASRRTELAMSKADLARRTGLGLPAIAGIEAGREVVPLHFVFRIAEALELPGATALLAATDEVKGRSPGAPEIAAAPAVRSETRSKATAEPAAAATPIELHGVDLSSRQRTDVERFIRQTRASRPSKS